VFQEGVNGDTEFRAGVNGETGSWIKVVAEV